MITFFFYGFVYKTNFTSTVFHRSNGILTMGYSLELECKYKKIEIKPISVHFKQFHMVKYIKVYY